MIPVTKPFQPPLAEYLDLLKQIWERNWYTNHGPVVDELETKLKQELGLAYLHTVTNGTIALQIAIKALHLKGEIITTPFTYIATSSSLLWEGCKPVFVDIDDKTFNIDVSKIEAKINTKTEAILATHVFGNPCCAEEIQLIANKYGLKVIYDAAHAFGVEYKGKSILKYGDISTLSFHATKLFHTIEGGAVISSNTDLHYKVGQLRNFGHTGPNTFDMVGINGKVSEVHAAMGLVNIRYIDEILENRKEISEIYQAELNQESISFQILSDGCTVYNYSYFPILLKNTEQLQKVTTALNNANIYPRRYFYPSLNAIPFMRSVESCPISDNISARVLCLPLYHTLEKVTAKNISTIINRTIS